MLVTDAFITELTTFIPEEQIHTDPLLVRAYSLDASPFEPRAQAIIDVYDDGQLSAALAAARSYSICVTFRGSGTGLNGQATGEGVVIRFMGDYWNTVTVHENGRSVTAGCAAKGIDVNNALAPFSRIIGPDPSSISAATIGGIAANNATGMCCTVEQNTFHTMTDMRFTLANGDTVDTRNRLNVETFRIRHSKLLDHLASIRERILESPELTQRIAHKYTIRNTCGYSLNAFTEFEDPLQILTHLLIGSEGTLGFIHDITLTTVKSLPHRATAFMLFPTMEQAANAVVKISHTKCAQAAELIDRVTLRSIENTQGVPPFIAELDDNACAVLLETRADDNAKLEKQIAAILKSVADIPNVTPHIFTTDAEECEQLWHIRRCIFSTCAGMRRSDEFALTEDFCVRMEDLADVCSDFQRIFKKYGVEKVAGIQGHAFHGNLHFILPLRLNDEKEVSKLHRMVTDLVDLIVHRYNGSLKAEHGTGRAIAPFVRLEWGDELYAIMQEVKQLLDPHNILNPGILLNEDPIGHISNLKHPVSLDPSIDLCVDCGFCEPICPTREVSLTPRQRIYAVRAITYARQTGNDSDAEKWEKTFNDFGRDMCATDGLCTTRCPLKVDVASYIRSLREKEQRSAAASFAATSIANNFGTVSKIGSALLTTASCLHSALPKKAVESTRRMSTKLTGLTLPDLTKAQLTGGSRPPKTENTKSSLVNAVVYYPSCAVRTMGYLNSDGYPVTPLMQTTLTLLERAGYNIIFPQELSKLCCGKAFETKGLTTIANRKTNELEQALYKASYQGKIPVLCDTSPCFARMKKEFTSSIELYEPITFTQTFLKDKLTFKQLDKNIALHATCSIRTMELTNDFIALAKLCAANVTIPESVHCCGFSGDKGFSHPNINASALRKLSEETKHCTEGYSISRTCETGLTLHSNIEYKNILYLLEEASR